MARPSTGSVRSVTAFVLVLAVGIVCLASLVARSSAPYWGVRIDRSPGADLPVADVLNGQAMAVGLGLRDGSPILAVDGVDARLLVGQELGEANAVEFLTPDGTVRVAEIVAFSPLHLTALVGGALVFAVLGAVVYRWAVDSALAESFLLFTTAFAAALAATPAGVLGHGWATLVAAAGATTASPALLTTALLFPRHLRYAGGAIRLLGLVTVGLVAVIATFIVRGQTYPHWLDALLSVWLGGNLVGAVLLFVARGLRPDDRASLQPIALGAVIGVAPLALFTALPRALGLDFGLNVEIAAVGTVAIPLAFTHAILRNRLFALDAIVRRILIAGYAILLAVALFAVLVLVGKAIGLGESATALIAAAVLAGVAAPLRQRTERIFDRWLYSSMALAHQETENASSADVQAIGHLAAIRARQVVPLQWAVCFIAAEDETWRYVAADGQAPATLGISQSTLPTVTAIEMRATVIPIMGSAKEVGVLLVGPRLDGSPIGSIEREALAILAGMLASPLEAAVLREQAEDETRFRESLAGLSRDLAEADSVVEVLRTTVAATTRLLAAERTAAWLRNSDGDIVALDADAEPIDASLCEVTTRALVTAEHDSAAFRIGSPDDGALALLLRAGPNGGTAAACLAVRRSGVSPFTSRDEQRAAEIAALAHGPFRRAVERVAFEEQLRRQAFYDSLTGLPNRALFLDRLDLALQRLDRRDGQVAVLFLDLDRFKNVNDSLGHAAGDELLVRVSHRLQSSVRSTDTVARLGGDEFTVLLEGQRARHDAVATAERILAALQRPVHVDGQEVFTSASIGIAVSTDPREPGDLLREADVALYRAKDAGKARYAVFDPQIPTLPATRIQFETDLHRALERDELRLHYQPIVALRNGQIVGAEALVRWEHPQRGLLLPGKWVSLAEENGLIVPIGRWVLNQACRQARAWQDAWDGNRPMIMSVNLSARQLEHDGLVADVEAALRETGLDPRNLEVEITETAAMYDARATADRLRKLKALGVRIAIDDFGTGYTSLSYLRDFPLDTLKIDRSFLGSAGAETEDTAIVRSVVALARELGLTVTAEGVETPAQLGRLRELGCDRGQGYLFARPLPAEEMEARFLSARNGTVSRPHLDAAIAAVSSVEAA